MTITYKPQVQLKSPPLPIFFIKKIKKKKSQVLLSFLTSPHTHTHTQIVMSNFPVHYVGLRLVQIKRIYMEEAN